MSPTERRKKRKCGEAENREEKTVKENQMPQRKTV